VVDRRTTTGAVSSMVNMSFLPLDASGGSVDEVDRKDQVDQVDQVD